MGTNTEPLNQDALAALLGNEVKTSTLERWRCTGDGPRFIRVGRTPLYARRDVDAWLASRTVSHTGETPAAVPVRSKRRR